MKFYKIPEDELTDLICNTLTLAALENGGVDSWGWYSDSITDFIASLNKENDTSFKYMTELAKSELQYYVAMEE